MAKVCFVPRKFSGASLALVGLVNGILAEYSAQGYVLSLRQLYYQMVARDHLPNTPRSYKNFGALVSSARLGGLVDWGMIEDRNREVAENSHWGSPAEVLESAALSYREDKWLDQPAWPVVMVEKDALTGILGPVCRRLDVPLVANKGYSSSSAMYELGQRLAGEYDRRGRERVVVLYLGDHDPSGLDMTRDVTERLEMFGYLEADGDSFEVRRLALNMDQVEDWRPPKNPAKEADARFAAYARQFGPASWELDAVEPAKLAALVEAAVLGERDDYLWRAAVGREEARRVALRKLAAEWRE